MNLAAKVKAAKRVFIIGNGGSAANAWHICNDLEAAGVRAYAINPATYSATANDYGHEFVFSRWIELHGEEGDLLIAMSGSGKSKNILNAIDSANRLGMGVHVIFGAPLGQDMQSAEEHQLHIGHEVWRKLSQTK